MYSPLSANFVRRIRESGRRKTVVDVYYDGLLVASDLAVSDGNIRVDLDGQVRRSGNITVADPRLVPTLQETLSPLGAEVMVRQGVVYPDGSEELIPMGIFRLDLTGWKDGENIPSIQIYDRSKALQAPLPDNLSRAGRTAKQVVVEFLEYFFPWMAPVNPVAVFGLDLRDYRLPGGHTFEQDSYWDAMVALCRNMGARLFFDVEGAPRATTIEQLSAASPAVLEISAGPGGVLAAADREHSREGVYNAVTVIGAASAGGAIPAYTAINQDPSSPMRWGGPFGKVRQEVTDSAITTYAQCVTRARAELARYSGLAYSVDFTAVPNPALDAGDFVRLRYADGSSEMHEISTLSIPIGKGTFQGTSKGAFING